MHTSTIKIKFNGYVMKTSIYEGILRFHYVAASSWKCLYCLWVKECPREAEQAMVGLSLHTRNEANPDHALWENYETILTLTLTK